MSEDATDTRIRISVSPEPGPEEMAAIGALVAALSRLQDGENGETIPSGGGREKWRTAGRRELLRPIDRDRD